VRREQAEHALFDDESFDIVCMFDVIEHVLDPVAVLRGARRVLRAEGVLLLNTPNFNALSRFALGSEWSVISPAEHLYYFTEATLRQGLACAGFSDVGFMRDTVSLSLLETMNPLNTHQPAAWRARAFSWFVQTLGRSVRRQVQRRGLADALWCRAVK
jgi:ubiquinone/menaquinone biosynthesis C-methylase UbiE